MTNSERRIPIDSIDSTILRFFQFFATPGGSRPVLCQSFSSVQRLEAEKKLKNENDKIWIFCQVRFDRFDNLFDSIDNQFSRHGGPPWISSTKVIPTARSFQNKSLQQRTQFRQQAVDLEDILKISEPFVVWKIRVPIFGEFSRSSSEPENNLRNTMK